MGKKPLEEPIRRAILDAVQEAGMDLFDLQVARIRNGWSVRIVIERKPGLGAVGHEDCERVSRLVKPVLEENLHGSLPGLEISSPGLNRPLRGPEEFKRFIGLQAKVTDGRANKTYKGAIEQVTDTELVMRCSGKVCRIELEAITRAALNMDPFTKGHWNE